MNALLGAKATWDLMRSSGFVTFGLLSLTVCLGIANVSRWQRGRWTRAVAALVHRNASLLAVAFLGIHVATAVTDRYVSIPTAAVVVPGMSRYDPLWVGLGALALDLAAAVVITSLLRRRLGLRAWRAVHWLAYLSWPTALLHAIGAGTGQGMDTGHLWSTAIYLVLGLAVAGAVAVRLATRHQPVAPATPAGRRPPMPTLVSGPSVVPPVGAPTARATRAHPTRSTS